MPEKREATPHAAEGKEASVLYKDYLHPSSRHLYVRLLRGGQYLHPEIPISVDASTLPKRPSLALSRLQRQWEGEREDVDMSVEQWAKNTTKATIVVIENADAKVRKVIKKAFTGWGVEMVKGSLLLQQKEIAEGFGGTFYENYCGNNTEKGVGHMATSLIETFAKEYDIANNPKNMVRVERSVLTVLDSLNEWLGKFYGREDLRDAFASCTKAELAAYAQRLEKESLAEALATPLREKEIAVLQTMQYSSISDEQAVVAPKEDSLETEEIPAHNGHNGHSTSEPILPSSLIDSQDSWAIPDRRDNPSPVHEEATFASSKHEMEKEEEISVLSEKRRDYYMVRLGLLALLSSFRAQADDFAVDELAETLGMAPQRLLLAVEKLKRLDEGGDSERIDEIIASSHFLEGISKDFGIFTLEAMQEMLRNVSQVCHDLRIGWKGKDGLLLPKDGGVKLSDKEVRRLVVELANILPHNNLPSQSYDVWTEDMALLPTLADQLYYFISQDDRVAALYEEIRQGVLDQELEKLFLQAGEEDIESVNHSRRYGAKGKEWDVVIPPLPQVRATDWIPM